MENQNKVILENGLEIIGATLLTTEEVEKLPWEILKIGCCWWWLRWPGNFRYTAAYVDSIGSVRYCGIDVDCTYGVVRPALIINLESSALQIGDKFLFGDKEFEIVSDTRALCTESIGNCAFREDWKAKNANDYESSDIKKFVDAWYQEQMNTLITPASSISVPSETSSTSETDDNWEMRYKDEQIRELQEIIAGVITEKGRYNMADKKWEINTSSILTRLIQEAGRWCSFYASDLFILWKYNIDEKLDNGTLDTGTFVFAFRESGVDNETGYEKNKENPHYYRAVWFLDVTAGEGNITMRLHK